MLVYTPIGKKNGIELHTDFGEFTCVWSGAGENILVLVRFSCICKVLYMFLLRQTNKYTQ